MTRRRRPGAVPAPRRVLLGAVAVVLGVAAHAGAGGTIDLDATTFAAALLTGALAAAGAGAGPLSPLRAGIVLDTGQLALHVALSGAAHDMAAMPGMDTSAPTGTLMLPAHAAVVLLVAALCSGADHALVRLLTALRHSVADAAGTLVRALTRPLPPVPARVVVAGVRTPVAAPVGVVVARTHRRRGPPVPPCAPVTPGGRPAGPDPTSERTP